MTTGRPTKYKAEYAKQAKKLCELGATQPQIADFFEVATSTVNLWAVQHKAFSDALKIGKAVADEKVEQALYHRAMGYSHPEDDIRAIGGELTITPTIKHYPPDTTACIFWLKNRKPKEWRAAPENDEPPKTDMTIQVIRAAKPL